MTTCRVVASSLPGPLRASSSARLAPLALGHQHLVCVPGRLEVLRRALLVTLVVRPVRVPAECRFVISLLQILLPRLRTWPELEPAKELRPADLRRPLLVVRGATGTAMLVLLLLLLMLAAVLMVVLVMGVLPLLAAAAAAAAPGRPFPTLRPLKVTRPREGARRRSTGARAGRRRALLGRWRGTTRTGVGLGLLTPRGEAGSAATTVPVPVPL